MLYRTLFCTMLLMGASAALSGCTHTQSTTRPGAGPLLSTATETYNLYLPGIGGWRNLDRRMLLGLSEGGLSDFEHYDWTVADPGLGALLARQRNDDEARKVSELIRDQIRAHPNARITIVTHSAGAGIIAWALERLPPDARIDSVVMLAPALSPTYDLSKALRHVTGRVYAFYSPYDAFVLGAGTTFFGTIDGVKTEASGKVGFTRPAGGDTSQYQKLIQYPYDSAWLKYDNSGDHIGTMSRSFAREVLAPLILHGALPDPIQVNRAPQTSRESGSRS